MNNSVVKIKLFFFAGFLCISTYGQSYLGFNTDNYSGLHGVITNPGNLADSRIRADINLFSFSAMGANDYISLSLDNINQFIQDRDFSSLVTTPVDDNNLLVSLEIMRHPLLMMKLIVLYRQSAKILI